jgi:hypothetical protein
MLRRCKTCGRDSIYKNGNEKCPYCKLKEIKDELVSIRKGFRANYFCKRCRLRRPCFEPCEGKIALLRISDLFKRNF